MSNNRAARFLLVGVWSAAFALLASAGAAAQTYTERLVIGFVRLTNAATPPGETGRIFVTEQYTGEIHVVDLTTNTVLATPYLSISDLSTGNEQGLLGLTFDPNYATNGYFYVNYTSADNNTQIVRYRVDGDPATSNVADPASAHPIVTIVQPQIWHNAGWIGFGPHDGYLYASLGDGGNSNTAQNITSGDMLGNILRLDVHGDDFPADPARNYAIPPDNPFANGPGDDEVWLYGLRNPWRASFDRETGDFWIGDVGANFREEINFKAADSPAALNYGWPLREGSVATPGPGGGPAPPRRGRPVLRIPALR
jgi:glucose/arabinose dehydrogenase